MKKITALVLALFFLLTFAGSAVAQVNLPEAPMGPDRYVQDYANLLTPGDRQSIIDISTAIQEKTKAEIVVVTVKSLEGQEIFDYSQNLFRKWGIGDKEKNNGILILVNKESLANNQKGKVRIHVGYGLEGALNDAKAGRILDDYMIPRFDNGQYSSGILEGYKAVANVVAGEYNLKLNTDFQPTPAQADSQPKSSKISKWQAILVVIIIVILLIVDNTIFGGFFTGMLLAILFSGGFRGGGGGFGGGGGGFGGGSSGGGGAER